MSNRLVWAGFISLMTFGWTANVCAQIVSDQNFTITQYGMDEGLPQSSVNDIIQTEDGYLWLATFGGLVKFDGINFTTYNRSNTEGMENDRILKIVADSEGGIWMFPEETLTMVFRLKDGKSTKFELREGLSPSIASQVSKDGELWLTAFDAAWYYDGEILKKAAKINNQDLAKKLIKMEQGAWIGIENSIYKAYGDTLVHVYGPIGNDNTRIVQIIENPADPEKLWVGTAIGGIIEIKKEGETDFSPDYTLPLNYLLNIKQDQRDNVFIMTADGILQWYNGTFHVLNAILPEKDIRIKTILQDNEGNYWVGTEGDGLFRLRKTIITMIDKDNGLANEKMLSLTQLKDGTMLFSTNCSGIYEWKNNRATHSPHHAYFEDNCNWSVFQDSKERIWLGAGNPYVTRVLDEKGREFEEEDGYTGFGVFAMMEDNTGQIWVATANGIFLYNEVSQRFTKRYTAENGLYYDHASALYQDTHGIVWVGTKAGLNKIENGKVTKVVLLAMDNEGKYVQQPWVRDIYEDEKGVLWFGSYGNGIFALKEGLITNITSNDGLFDDIVSHIVKDENDYFWMGSNRGISRVAKSELDAYLAGEVDKVTSYSYGIADGMNSPETNGGFQPSTIYDDSGNIYFPTVEGVAVVSTREVKKNEVPPPVFVEKVRSSNGKEIDSDLVELDFDDAFLEINYTAINFTDPEKVRFKYRMQGLDDTWIEAGKRRSAIYSKIPPGDYTFQVIASNNDGVWNNTGASLSIAVIPPFWQTNWFYGLIALVFLTSGPSIYYYRVTLLREENEKQKRFTEQLIQSQENERQRIASELHDSLGQQILVIKNRVEMVQNQMKDANGIAHQLNEIKTNAERSIGEIRAISHGLRPVLLEKFGLTEALKNLCSQIQSASQMEWSYFIDAIDGIIPESKEIHFYRVIQEAINNILKHAQAKEASVIVKKTDAGVRVKIWDDGKGFDPKILQNSNGLGYLGMKERVEALKGTIHIQSVPGTETVININIPRLNHE